MSAENKRADSMRQEGSGGRPVIVGVTGHRNLGSGDAALIKLIGRELARVARANDGAPLLVLSGLAEGADRIVVEAARALGTTYRAIVPLPDALYLKDFADGASRADYAALCANAERVVTAPLMASRRALETEGEPRNHQYAWIGAYIAKRAQVLIALWDGMPARGTGGTAHVVDWFLAGRVPRSYNISRAPRLAERSGVAGELIHINPSTLKVRRAPRRLGSGARGKA